MSWADVEEAAVAILLKNGGSMPSNTFYLSLYGRCPQAKALFESFDKKKDALKQFPKKRLIFASQGGSGCVRLADHAQKPATTAAAGRERSAAAGGKPQLKPTPAEGNSKGRKAAARQNAPQQQHTQEGGASQAEPLQRAGRGGRGHTGRGGRGNTDRGDHTDHHRSKPMGNAGGGTAESGAPGPRSAPGARPKRNNFLDKVKSGEVSISDDKTALTFLQKVADLKNTDLAVYMHEVRNRQWLINRSDA
jgi:hypothetical protein